MNHVTGFHVDYDDARKEYEVHIAYSDDTKKVGRKEFQFYCGKHIFEQLAKDVLSKHQVKMIDKCPACGQSNISSEYQYNDKDAVIAGSGKELPEEYLDGYIARTCRECGFIWRVEPLWKNCKEY